MLYILYFVVKKIMEKNRMAGNIPKKKFDSGQDRTGGLLRVKQM